jgi:drug/metabolite transporter (DMT)-like permease
MISQSAAALLLALSILALAGSQLLAKARLTDLADVGTGRTLRPMLAAAIADPLMWLVAALVVGGAALWYLAMIRIPVSVMVPLASLVSPIVAVGAHYFLGESLSPSKVAAIGLVAAGGFWLAVQST